MRPFVNKYETEVRLGLVVIVVLLLLLNLGSSYILQNVQRQLTERIDGRLTEALGMAAHYLAKNQTDRIPDDQAYLFRQQFGLTDIFVAPLDLKSSQGIQILCGPKGGLRNDLARLSPADGQRLLQGRYLFRTGNGHAFRYGLAAPRSAAGRNVMIAAVTDARALASLAKANRTVFYLAAGMLILIIPLAVLMPRMILRPFRKMRETARSAGRLPEGAGGDDVAAVTASYQAIIEELKQNEAELLRLYRETSSRAGRLETFHQYLLQSIGAGVITVDLSGMVVGFNRAAGEILGHDPAGSIGKHYLTALSEEDSLGLLIEAGLLRNETSSAHDLELAREDKPVLWLAAESSVIHDDTGRAIGVAVMFADQTVLKKLQAELEINRRMAALGEMTGGLAHQLRNSLAAMSGFCQLLAKKTNSDPALTDIAESIRSEAVASAAMVGRFLNFARPLKLNAEPVDLLDILDECIRKMQDRAGQERISITYRRPDKACLLAGDPLFLREAFGNVLDNALQAAGQEGWIEIALEPGETESHVIIADSGPGISDSIRDKLFTPFFSSKPSGTGLGLALTRKIISLHNGSIIFDEGRRWGAVCRITLPLTTMDYAVATSAPPADTKKS
ncbi:MAG: ATP-binding protein [candidate division Zixibacteria bacterium]|nr:ATP-binding protein [candidate division Zixibacteria bacterium]